MNVVVVVVPCRACVRKYKVCINCKIQESNGKVKSAVLFRGERETAISVENNWCLKGAMKYLLNLGY